MISHADIVNVSMIARTKLLCGAVVTLLRHMASHAKRTIIVPTHPHLLIFQIGHFQINKPNARYRSIKYM